VIILTKGIAIEGPAIIARERADEVARIFGKEALARCQNFVFRPGISVLKDAVIATESGEIHSMHDPTEGGLATALHEVARAAEVGVVIESQNVPVYGETRILCDHYGLDSMGLIASGALLIVLARGDTQKVLANLESKGIQATIIGWLTEKKDGLKLITPSGTRDLPLYECDELTKVPSATV
jgi:hydrogenase maturation factor